MMEEEYRMQKAHGDISAVANGAGKAIHEDGTVRDSMISSDSATLGDQGVDDDNASTRGMVSPHSPRKSGSLDVSPSAFANGSTVSIASSITKVGLGLDPNGGASLTATIPTIRISTESDRDFDEDGNATDASPKGKDVNGDAPKATTNGFDNSRDVSELGLEKPAQAAAGTEEGGLGDDKDKESLHESPLPSTQTQSGSESFSFSNKRLCERWLDNLFMVLYEDLRVWTIFRAEVAHFKTQHVAYRKTGLEWEILGDLGMRLHHKEEAKEACFNRL